MRVVNSQLAILEPLLHLFKQRNPSELYYDASSCDFGAVLQKGDEEKFHFIQYMWDSKKTTSRQEKYCRYELEIQVIIKTLTKYGICLVVSKLKIVTDSAALKLNAILKRISKICFKERLCFRLWLWMLTMNSRWNEIHKCCKSSFHCH